MRKDFATRSLQFFHRKARNLYLKLYFALTGKEFKKRYGHLPRNLYSLLLNNMGVVQLAEKLDVSFGTEKEFLVADIPIFDKNVKFILDKQVCFDLLWEQFLTRRDYNFIFDVPVAVIDIGMNVGDTALFFAANPFVKKVYSYELMPQTFDRAQRNLKINPDIMNKIEGHNYGLGKSDQELVIYYYDESDGQIGKVSEILGDELGKGIPTKCKIKNVVHEIQKIEQEHPNVALYLKIDTEGAEYEIIDALLRDHSSNNIHYIAIEYHFGVQNIIETLREHHFEVIERFYGFYRGDNNLAQGIIQAIRQSTNTST